MDTQNKIYLLNLQQQVRKNQLLIESLAQGLKITGAGETLPEQAAEMDAYLLSGEDGYSLYLRISGEWIDMGRFPAPGEQGPAGPKGSVGTIGSIVCNATPIDFGLNPSVRATVSGDNVTFDFELPRGETGIQGPQGPQGPRGLTGPRGLQGQQGDPGKAFRLFQNDSVVTPSDLPAASTAGEGVGYLVGTLGSGYELYVTANDPLEWVDAGPFVPNQVVVDQNLDYASDDAVANKPVSYALAYGWTPDVTIEEGATVSTSSNMYKAVRYGFPFLVAGKKYHFVDAYSTGGGMNQNRVFVSFSEPSNVDLIIFWGNYLSGYSVYEKKSVALAKKEDLDAEIARSTREDEIHQREIVLLKNLVYDTIAASYSYNIDYAFYASIPASVEVSGQYHSILDDAGAQIEKIMGSSVVWNQLNQNLSNTSINSGVNYVKNNDNSWTISGTATGGNSEKPISREALIQGHKYFFFCSKPDENMFLSLYGSGVISASSSYGGIGIIGTASGSGNAFILVYIKEGESVNFTSTFYFIDLTQLYPIDTPTSIGDPRLLPILMNPDKPYAAPVIKSSVVKAVKSRGFNLWDEQWELGSYNIQTGEKSSISTAIRSKNATPIIGGDTYCILNPTANAAVLFYDASGIYLGLDTVFLASTSVATFQAPTGAAFLRFTVSGTTYQNNICVNKSNASLNGTYKPHVADQLVDLEALGLTEAQRTLRSAGTVKDDLSLVEQQDGTYNLVKNTLTASYTFTGNETWNSFGDCYYCSVLDPVAKNTANNVVSNSISSIGQPNTVNSLYGGTLGGYNVKSNNLYISSDLYTDRSNLVGQTICYEFASPTSETLLTGLEFGAIELIVERGGSFNVDADNAEYGAVPGLVMDLPILMYE